MSVLKCVEEEERIDWEGHHHTLNMKVILIVVQTLKLIGRGSGRGPKLKESILNFNEKSTG